MQEFLAKASRGEKVKVAVLGGSGQCQLYLITPITRPPSLRLCRRAVSLGHGKAGPVTLGHFDLIWHQFILRHLQSVFPAADQIEYVHGAKAGCGSDYFSWCFPAHITSDVDLVFVESAVNDGFGTEYFRDSERLLRALLSLPTAPAVVYVDSFALDNAMGQKASLNGGDAHNHLGVRYDVPVISLRAAGLTALMARRELVGPWFEGDKHHITVPQHEMLGLLVVAYLQEQACELERGGWERERIEWRGEEGLPGMGTLGQIPKVSLLSYHALCSCFPPGWLMLASSGAGAELDRGRLGLGRPPRLASLPSDLSTRLASRLLLRARPPPEPHGRLGAVRLDERQVLLADDRARRAPDRVPSHGE